MVTLPKKFKAKRVEVIIFPSNEYNELSNETKKMLDDRLEQYHNNPTAVYDFDKVLKDLENEI